MTLKNGPDPELKGLSFLWCKHKTAYTLNIYKIDIRVPTIIDD